MARSRRNSLLLALLLSLPGALFASTQALWLWPEDNQRMVDYAVLFEGAPYSFGARRPSSEDCSSLVQKIFSLVGIELPRSSREQVRDPRFVEVPLAEMRPGDLIFFRNTYRRGVSHVGFMMNADTMLHASPRDRQVARSSFSPAHPLWRKVHSVRRWRHVMEGDHLRPQYTWDDKL